MTHCWDWFKKIIILTYTTAVFPVFSIYYKGHYICLEEVVLEYNKFEKIICKYIYIKMVVKMLMAVIVFHWIGYN